MGTHGEITEQKDWDVQWGKSSPARIISGNDPILGSNGSLMRVIKRNIGDVKGIRVLELGGASSYFLLTLVKFGSAKAVAIDYSSEGINYLRKIFSINNCKIDAYVADIFQYDFQDEEFDLIVHWGLIEHFKQPEHILRICADHLSPQGKILFTMPNMKALGASLWEKWDTADWKNHIYHTSSTIKDACERVNLRMVKEFYWGPPLLFNIGYWKDTGVIPFIIKQVVRCLSLLNRLIPFYQYGVSGFSAHRSIIAENLTTDK